MNSEQNQQITVLVVDDSATDRAIAGSLISSAGYEVAYAKDGKDAIRQIEHLNPEIVLTDLQMPGLDGLGLVAETRVKFAHIPVILMTGVGSEEIAAEALRLGAANYVPKRNLNSELTDVLRQIIESVFVRPSTQISNLFRKQEAHFELGYEGDALATLVNHQQESLAEFELADDADLVRIGIALTEALNNAIEHGNLELSSTLKEADDGSYHQLRSQRTKELPYRDRTVYFENKLSREEAIFIVRDMGQGYDPSQLPDPTDPENLVKASGRGMLLIRTFMDEVRFNSVGNEITMVKRRDSSNRSPTNDS